MKKIDEDLKKAIVNLPPKEKDRLIFKLLRKDEKLANKLYFELVSDESVEERRQKELTLINQYINHIREYVLSPQGIHAALRMMTTQINQHVYTTKDKYGEIFLNIYMLEELLKLDISYFITNSHFSETQKLLKYLTNKFFSITLQLDKLHKDYFIDFEKSLYNLAESIENKQVLAKECRNRGFLPIWFKTLEIPENIKDLYKTSKQL